METHRAERSNLQLNKLNNGIYSEFVRSWNTSMIEKWDVIPPSSPRNGTILNLCHLSKIRLCCTVFTISQFYQPQYSTEHTALYCAWEKYAYSRKSMSLLRILRPLIVITSYYIQRLRRVSGHRRNAIYGGIRPLMTLRNAMIRRMSLVR